MSQALRSVEERRDRAAAPATLDDRSVLVGMDRAATPDELRAFIAGEQARIRATRKLPAA